MQTKNTLKVFQIENTSDLVNTGLLLLLGFFAVLLRENIDVSLKLPGHHGFEFMLLFLAGRLLTDKRYGMSISSIGASASAFLPIFHFGNAFMPFTLLLPGIIGDLLINSRSKTSAIFIAIAGGLGYATLPVMRQTISMLTGIPFGSLLNGLLYPMAMHFVFGAAGAYAGYFLARQTRNF